MIAWKPPFQSSRKSRHLGSTTLSEISGVDDGPNVEQLESTALGSKSLATRTKASLALAEEPRGSFTIIWSNCCVEGGIDKCSGDDDDNSATGINFDEDP
ncbi:hypothetical protein NL676_018217 [Syzygium grande]|nr:hypothetical protein NL676_018217 [Syzygium grande]